MIRIKTNIDVEKELFGVKEYKYHKSCMLEHLGLILFLMEQIMEQDEKMTEKELFKILKDMRKEMEVVRNGKTITKNE